MAFLGTKILQNLWETKYQQQWPLHACHEKYSWHVGVVQHTRQITICKTLELCQLVSDKG
jgi:hypothetical protein